MEKMRTWLGTLKVVLGMGFFSSTFGQAISPLLVGQNVWNNPSTQVWKLVADCGVQSVRIGGIGYDESMPSNATLLSWVTSIKQMGAEPIMQVPRAWSAQQAANLVTYFNKQNPTERVTYWQIGNEPDNGSAGNVIQDAAAVATYIRSLAPAMKAVDPTIKIYVPSCSWLNTAYYPDLVGGDQDICGKDANGNWMVDGIDFHAYPFGASYSYAQVVSGAAAGIRSSAASLLSLMNAADAKDGRPDSAALRWGLTEFNITYANPSPNGKNGYGVNSFVNGQFFAEVFGIGMADSTSFMNTWSMFESNGDESSSDLSFLDGSAMTPRSSYYHMQLIAENFSGTYAAGTSNLTAVRAYGCKDTAKICVLLLNEETTAQRAYTVQLNTTPITGSTESKINIDAGLNRSYSDTLVNQSTQLLVFTADGQLEKKFTYSLTLYEANQPPSEQTFIVNPIRTAGKTSALGAFARQQGNMIVVTLPEITKASVDLMTSDGRTLQSIQGRDRLFRINCSALATGVYFVKIRSETGTQILNTAVNGF